MSYQPRIAIAGGGPSGLALGLLLRQRGLSPTIYELRSKPTPEELDKPSGMLDLHQESGQVVMHQCGLWDEFLALTGECSESCRILDPQANVLHTDEGEISERPEISRNSLTKLLVKDFPPESIKWNHKILAVTSSINESSGATEITIDLGENGKAIYDFVVGADGAWSRVRNLLTDVKPFYTGAHYLTATMRDASTKYPHLSEMCGSGMFIALGGCNGLLAHRGPHDSIRLYACVTTPHENWRKDGGFEGMTAADMTPMLLKYDKYFGKWAPSLQELLVKVCEEETKDNPGQKADILPINMLPVGHRWENKSGATLVGDAAHLMSPWAGEGVNMALQDSLELSYALGDAPKAENAAEWQKGLEPRVREFEEAMHARTREKAAETNANKDMFLSENGGHEIANMMKGAYAGVNEQKQEAK